MDQCTIKAVYWVASYRCSAANFIPRAVRKPTKYDRSKRFPKSRRDRALHSTLLGTLMATYDYRSANMEDSMNGLIYLVGLVVVILAVLSFFGLR